MDNKTKDDINIAQLKEGFKDVSTALYNGDYSKRLSIDSNDSEIKEIENDLNQILELLEINLEMSLLGDDSILSEFIEVFSAFANRDFSKTLQISEKGTILDAVAAGINMLGQELEFSTVSKNELKVETNRLNESQNIAKIADWEFHIRDKKIVYSQSFSKILDLESQDFMEMIKDYKDLLIGENKITINNTIRKIQINPYYAFENEILSKDNSVKYLSHIVTHIYNKNNKLIGYKGIVQDITTLKEFQNKLKYQTELEKLISEISSSFIKSTSNFKHVINNALHQCSIFFNIDRTYFLKFLEDDISTLEIYEHNNEFVKYDTRKLLLETPELFKNCINTSKNEESIQMCSTKCFLKDTSGEKEQLEKFKVKSFICIPTFNDKVEIGLFGMDSIQKERIWTEEEMNGLKIIANIISDAIYRNIYVKELIVARKKAEESESLKSAFLANMSHEIRTPMNGILGFTELLSLPNISGDKQEEFIEIIRQSGNRMLNTIDDIISMSRIDSNQVKLNASEVDIVEMSNSLYNFFKPEAEKNNISLNLNLPDSSQKTVVISDQEKLYAILTNLIKNALKFTNEGSIDFGYTLEKKKILFFVKDTGIGIKKEKQESIFERFVQADLNLNRGHEGSGLGLAISKAYLKIIGGNIWCESEKGKGSTFYFTINSDWKHVGISNNKTEEFNNTNKRNCTILIAEDDLISRDHLNLLLEDYCTTILHAENGQIAVDLCKENNEIDLILMDIKMPVLDGHTAAILIKEFRPNLPIITQTAYSLKEEKIKYGDIFDEYLTKPIDRVSFLKSIFKHLDKN